MHNGMRVRKQPNNQDGIVQDFSVTNKTFKIKWANGRIIPDYKYPDDFVNFLEAIDPNDPTHFLNEVGVCKGILAKWEINGGEHYGQHDNRKNNTLNPIDISQAQYLRKGDVMGTNAHQIYIDMCNYFNWNVDNAGKFSQQQRLYDQNVNGKGYSAWFIYYSTYNSQVTPNSDIYNIIEPNNDIDEIFSVDSERHPVENSEEIKIVFIKNAAGQYEFWGVMKVDNVVKEGQKEIHQIYLSDTYDATTDYK